MSFDGRPPSPKTGNPVKTPEGRAHMAQVAQLPCCICCEWDLEQTSHTQVHHVIHDRFGNRKACDLMTIPLCEGHHQGLRDTTKLAIHQSPKEWRTAYGPDHEWLSWVEQHLGLDPI